MISSEISTDLFGGDTLVFATLGRKCLGIGGMNFGGLKVLGRQRFLRALEDGSGL